MFLADLLFALAIALLLTGLFSLGFRRRDPWGNIFLFILLFFLLVWAAGAWIPPIGPTIYDVAWIPMIVVGLVFLLLLVAAIPAEPSYRRRPAEKAPMVTESAIVALGVVFWLLILILLGAIIVAYIL
jgi:hypothetical protein